MAEANSKTGRPLKPAQLERIVKTLADPTHDGKSQRALARLASVSVRTLRDYSTPHVLAEAAALRHQWINPSMLMDVDRAMLAKAREGNVAAARLVYLRMEALKSSHELDEPPTLEELEHELAKLKTKASQDP